MTLPITGPIEVSTSSGRGPGAVSRTQTRYKQKAPFDLALPYKMSESRVLSSVGHEWTWTETPGVGYLAETRPYDDPSGSYSPRELFAIRDGYYDGDPWTTDAVNRARDKFVGQMGEACQLLVNAAERGETKMMIAKRAKQLWTSYDALRHGEISAAATALGLGADRRSGLIAKAKEIMAKKDWRNGLRHPGQIWLEWHFGWEPLMQDIRSAATTLCEAPPRKLVVARSTIHDNWTWSDSYGSPPSSYGWRRATHTVLARARVSAWITVNNSNLFMANQLGLLNPLATAWELIPYSFLVDHFANVSSYLNQLTDFSGITMDKACWTWYRKDTCSATGFGWSNWLPGETSNFSCSSQSVRMERALGVPGVRFRFKMPDRLSWQRGLTYMALLAGHLGSK